MSQVMTLVVSAKNGSNIADTGSGISVMSDSLMVFQPAIEEPSNIVPSEKISSSIIEMSNVTCCDLPRGSVKRRSTYFTSLSLMAFRTSWAVFMYTPYVTWIECFLDLVIGGMLPSGWVRRARAGRVMVLSDSVDAGFPGANADGLLDVGDENLAVADAPGLGCAADGVDGFVHEVVADHNLDFDLRQEVHDVFRAPVQFGVALLAAEALGLGYGDALKADFLKGFLHFIELERLDDRLDFFHLNVSGISEPRCRWRGTVRSRPLKRPRAMPLKSRVRANWHGC